MSTVITVENLGKKYLLSHQTQKQSYVALRDVIAEKTSAYGQRLLHPFLSSPLTPHSSQEDFWALKDVSFEIKQGDRVGIIGRNGAGKSTLLKILSRIVEPTIGRVKIKGRVASLLEVGTGFHPELTGRENIFLNGAILGMTRAEIKKKFDEIVDFAEIEKFLDTPVKRYSSGMYVRLAFAVAAHLEPEILLVDEVLAVGDAQFQKKCLGKMDEVSKDEGRTVLFVSHNLQAVRQLCPRCILLDKGEIEFKGDSAQGIYKYLRNSGSIEFHDKSQLVRESNYSAVIAGIRYLDSNGEIVCSYRRGDRINVEVSFVVFNNIKQLEISMAVHHSDGTPLFSSTIYDEMKCNVTLEPGNYKNSFDFDVSFLKNEPYSVTIYLLDTGKVLDHVDEVPIPEVSSHGSDLFIEARRWGVLLLPVHWSDVKRV